MSGKARTEGLTIEKQQRLFDALALIARSFKTVDQIHRNPDWGLETDEELEMAYENIQCIAKSAIKGMRRPKARREVSKNDTKI